MSSSPCPLSVEEHLRQLQRVYGPLGPAFAAEELQCSLEAAALHLYGSQVDEHCWVSLADMVRLCGADKDRLKRWVQGGQIPRIQRRGQGRGRPLLIRLTHARQYLNLHPAHAAETPFPLWEYLPRFTEQAPQRREPARPTRVQTVDLDWQLARRAAWPMTPQRLADAVYGGRSAGKLRRARRLLGLWETQGRVTCFARGLYDLVRPALVLRPEGYGRRALPLEDLKRLRTYHPEITHWQNGSLAAAWRSYSRLYGEARLPVFDRREPSLLEYLMVRQLHPEVGELRLDAQYEALCREVVFYRLVAAPVQEPVGKKSPAVTVANIEAGLIDFKALAELTRRKMQRGPGKGHDQGGAASP